MLFFTIRRCAVTFTRRMTNFIFFFTVDTLKFTKYTYNGVIRIRVYVIITVYTRLKWKEPRKRRVKLRHLLLMHQWRTEEVVFGSDLPPLLVRIIVNKHNNIQNLNTYLINWITLASN